MELAPEDDVVNISKLCENELNRKGQEQSYFHFKKGIYRHYKTEVSPQHENCTEPYYNSVPGHYDEKEMPISCDEIEKDSDLYSCKESNSPCDEMPRNSDQVNQAMEKEQSPYSDCGLDTLCETNIEEGQTTILPEEVQLKVDIKLEEGDDAAAEPTKKRPPERGNCRPCNDELDVPSEEENTVEAEQHACPREGISFNIPDCHSEGDEESEKMDADGEKDELQVLKPEVQEHSQEEDEVHSGFIGNHFSLEPKEAQICSLCERECSKSTATEFTCNNCKAIAFACEVCTKASTDWISQSTDCHKCSKKSFGCDVCGKIFSKPQTLVLHRFSHLSGNPNQCHICGAVMENPGALQNHRCYVTSEKAFTCEVCGKAFPQAAALRSHSRIHTGVRPFPCEVCGKAFFKSSDLRRHSFIHTGERPYSCELCGRAFSRLEHLKKHARTHTGDRPFVCTECGKAFYLFSELKHHTTTHNGDKPFECESCGTAFFCLTSLLQHTRIHRDTNAYVCDLCGTSFENSDELQAHTSTHRKQGANVFLLSGEDSSGVTPVKTLSGAQPHLCGVCGKGFAVVSSLKRHSRIHSGERPHTCETCGRAFSVLSNLQKHTRIHSGERPYSCTVCGKTFSRSDTLKKHSVVHS